MNIIIAAGGTAGHINPALAIASFIKEKNKAANIVFVGRQDGMEYDIVTRAGYKFYHLEVTGFQRRLNLNNIKRNIKTVYNLLFANKNANKILEEVKPSLVIGTGGYVTGPILLAAAKKGIKTAIHEQNAFAGITNKILSKKVDRVFVAASEAAKYMAKPSDCIVSYNPVRKEILTADKEKAREELNVKNKTVVLSFGGSLGALMINNAMKNLVLHNKNNKDIVHYHIVGKYDNGDFKAFLKENNIKENENVFVFEYLYDIPKYMAAADIVISRCGALTIAEIAAMKKASILIPSPNVSENHQYYNGKVLEDLNAAILLEEKDLNKLSITKAFDELYSNPNKIIKMGENAHKAYNENCLEIIYNNLPL